MIIVFPKLLKKCKKIHEIEHLEGKIGIPIDVDVH